MTQFSLTKMQERKLITPAYSSSTMKIFKKKFITMLIGSEVHLLHAHDNDGVYREDFQLVVSPSIKTSVLCLSPNQDNSHVKKLLKLTSLFMATLYHSTNKDAFKRIERRYKDGVQKLI